MNLAQLEHLLALAETGSFSKAAERVHLTQPALSRSVRALEDELGGKLVDRIGKKNELTALGSTIVARARQVLSGAAELKQAAQRVRAGEIGALRIGLGSSPASILTAHLLMHGAQNYPHVTIAVSHGRADQLLNSLRERELDVLVIDERSVAPELGFAIEPLPDMRAGIFFRRGHPLAARNRIGIEDLLEYPIASTAISPEVARGLVESFGPSAHPDKLITLHCDDIAPLIETACNTDTVFLGLHAAARGALSNKSLVEGQIRGKRPMISRFCIVTLEGRAPSPLLPMVRTLVAKHLKD